jgi:hypothetical protein
MGVPPAKLRPPEFRKTVSPEIVREDTRFSRASADDPAASANLYDHDIYHFGNSRL